MISYELAKELKDAGFPQNGSNREIDGSRVMVSPQKGDVLDDDMYVPTLSELIEACGENLWYITRLSTGSWRAADNLCEGFGPSPEEAVARLWLALQKKV